MAVLSLKTFLRAASALLLAGSGVPLVSVGQSTDLKVVINNQIKYQQALQEQDRGSFANAAIESYRSIKDAKAYLKSQGIPDFSVGDKNLEALSNAYYGGKLAERRAREAYISRLRMQLSNLGHQTVIGGQPVSLKQQETIESIVKALEVQSDLEKQYAQKQKNSERLQSQLEYQLQVQERTEATQREIQQRQIQQAAQPLAPQQVTTINTMVQQLQQQQQRNQQQIQQMQQMQQQQQQTQPMNPQQQQMLGQLVQALQSQIQQGQANQQRSQQQQHELQRLH